MGYECDKCKILIVEDELLVRKALRYIIEQESDEFEIIGEVTNGEEALEFLEQSLPHMMICDIMMPRMNGLELLRAVNLKYPEVSTIILSGYQDFEYVKSAFKYGVFDYILKPELESDYLLRALRLLGRKKGVIHTKDHGSSGGEEACPEQGDACSTYYLIAIQPGKILQGATNKQELTIGHMEEMIKEAFGRFYLDSFMLKKSQVYIYTIGCFYPEMFDGKLRTMTGQGTAYLRNIEMIISPPYGKGVSLETEAQKLSELFSYRFFDSRKDYLDLRETGILQLPALDQKTVCDLVRQQKAGTAGAVLVEYLSSLRGMAVSEMAVKKLMESTLYNTIFELNENEFCPPQLEERKLSFLTAIGTTDSLEGLIGAIAAIYQEIGQITEEARGSGLYLRITEYLYRHYSEPVTLKTLAADFNMNYSYLSSYFSSHMGQGINEFLNSVRVEKAKELLTASELSLVVVSSIVLTNFCTIASSDWITKNLFIQSSTFLNAKLMDNIKKKVEENNNSYLMLLRLLETKPALKNYFLAADACGTEKFIKTYDILKVYHDSVPSGTAQNLVAVSNQGSAFSFTGERISVPVEEIENMPCSLKISETSRRLQYTYQDHGITDDFKDRKCVIAARRLFLPSSSESFATAYITIPEEEFYQMFSEAVPEGSRMVILSSDGQIVSGNVKDSLGSEETKLLSLVRSMRENGDTYRTVKENHKPEIVISGYIPELDMYMVNTVEEAALLKSYAGIRRNILVTGFLITGTAIAVVFLIMRRIVSPLNFFIQQLETFKNRRFEKVSPVKGNSEVRQMADVYNRMVDEIDSYVKQLMEEQERGRRLEIEALQMQINPHFMYNTLASIKYLTWENNTEKASDTINALIAILKKTIGNMEEEITLREEIDLVRQYVFINQVRYGDRIEVEYFLAEEGMECMVPKLILQPFIENAFFHAFQNKKEGKIRIFAKKQRDDLICEIIDEGDGMSQEETADLLSSDRRRHLTGIGIPNVHERLRLIYGEEYGVTIHSVIGTGTSVSLRLPYHLKKLPKL